MVSFRGKSLLLLIGEMMGEEEVADILGNRIRILRTQDGYTQQELAELCGFSKQTLMKWEQGVSVPKFMCLLKIAEEFRVPMNYFDPRVDIFGNL